MPRWTKGAIPQKRGEIPITQDDFPRLELIPERAEQRGLAGLLAGVRTHGQSAQGSSSQRDDGDQSGQRKSHAGFLRAGLRKHLLIGRGVGHRDRTAVDQRDLPPFPEPGVRGLLLETVCGALDQIRDDLQREALAGLAIAAGLRATGLLAV